MEAKQFSRTVLILSVDKEFLEEIESKLSLKGLTILKAKSTTEALSMFEKQPADIVFVDIEKMPLQEMDFVNYIKTGSPRTEIIILTTINEIDNATYSLRHGASFYLMKPVACLDMKNVIGKLFTKIERNSEYIEFEQRILSDLMAGNPVMQKVLKLSIKIAPTASNILISGETGTGKEFFAKIIHRMSQRLEGKFVVVNCGAIPDTLFESELFGHEKGAFTGADRDKTGLVEEANMGTLFIDEVGELSPSAQVKLLRFVQEHSYRRIGETTVRTVNVRVIAATNKNLSEMVKKGAFREDLFYRINVFSLHLPPLRERKETIPNLIRLFVHRNNTVFNKNINKISKAAEVVLAEYDYPGNVRELENILEHAMILAEGSEIKVNDLPEFMFGKRLMLKSPDKISLYREKDHETDIDTLEEIEKRHIKTALKVLNYSYTEAAKKLGISRSTLWRKVKNYKIQEE